MREAGAEHSGRIAGTCFKVEGRSSLGAAFIDGETVLFNGGIYSDGMAHAITGMTEFTKRSNDTYERFDDAFCAVAVGMDEVRRCLRVTGFGNIRITSSKDPVGTCEDPESLRRAFFFVTE